MPDLDIDQLNIRISSDSKAAEDSLTGLSTALTNLKKDLGDVGRNSNAISRMSKAFESLSKTKRFSLSGRFVRQLQALGNIDLRASGVNSFVSAMTKFSQVSKSLDFSALKEMRIQLTQLSGVSEDTTKVIKAVASFARAGEQMKDTANNFPALALEIREFFDEMANVSISDNTVRMAEALAQISQNGKKASSAMQGVNSGAGRSASVFSKAQTVMRLFGSTLRDTASMLKSIGSSLINISKSIGSGLLKGVKSLVAQFRELTSASSGLKSLASNLKMLLGTFVGFYGIRSAFNWVKDAVISGADVAETNHIIEATFGELAADVDEWAQGTMQNYGIAENAAKRYAGTLGAVFQSSGVSMEESEEMSKKLVGIAGDLSSFYNIDTETVYTKLKSGMAGMVRPLRKQYCACVQKCA